MRKEVKILIAEDNNEHFELIKANLLEVDVHSEILHFADGQALFDFLFNAEKADTDEQAPPEYIVLTELKLPNVDGMQVLEKIKQDTQLKKIPVVILTATDDQDTIDRCYSLKCSTYIVKPEERPDFEDTIQSLGRFLSFVETAFIEKS